MKTLLIMRHAKSSWQNPDLDDHIRPLNERGKRDAPRMGESLRAEGLVPDLIVSSTAKRARKTADKVAKASGYDGQIELNGDLYHGEPKTWFELLRNVPDDVHRVMIIGHNPGLEGLLIILTGRDERLPTAAVAQVELPVDRWQDLNESVAATLLNLWRPKEI